jgi:hypothetical protein
MAHAEARVSALFQICRWASETVDQKAAETIFGTGQIMRGVHGSENVIGWDLAIEGGHQAAETIGADGGVNFVILHQTEV